MFDFVSQNFPIVVIVGVGLVAAIVLFVIELVRGHGFSKSIKNLKENIEMILPKKNSVAQSFSEFEKDYILDEKTGELLEKEVPRNVQKEVDSHKDIALNIQLAHLLPDPSQSSVDVDDYYDRKTDLDMLTESYDIINDVREAYGLPETASYADIKKKVDEVVSAARKKLVNPDASAQVGDKKEVSHEEKVQTE